jgi:hypothetical protein
MLQSKAEEKLRKCKRGKRKHVKKNKEKN